MLSEAGGEVETSLRNVSCGSERAISALTRERGAASLSRKKSATKEQTA